MEFAIPQDTQIRAGHVGLSSAQVIEFRSTVSRTSLSIDREARTIDNVILAQVGEARGHGVEIEQSFMDDMHRYVTKQMGDRVQCNFGHRWNSLGFQLGKFSDLRVEKNKYVGKLSVYKAADKSPEMQGMAEWFFEMAEEDAKSVMCSIKFEPLHYYQYDDKGQKIVIQYSWWAGPIKVYQDKPAYVAFKRLISCDIVDEGALTDSLFSDGDQGAPQMFAGIVNAPGFAAWFKDNHHHFPQFAQFYHDETAFSFRKFFTSIFSKDMDPKESAPAAAPVAASSTPETPAAPPAAETQVDLTALQASITAMQAQITELQSQLSTKDAEITALKKAPAADPVSVKDEDPARVDASEGNLWDKNPINMRVKAMARSKVAQS